MLLKMLRNYGIVSSVSNEYCSTAVSLHFSAVSSTGSGSFNLQSWQLPKSVFRSIPEATNGAFGKSVNNVGEN